MAKTRYYDQVILLNIKKPFSKLEYVLLRILMYPRRHVDVKNHTEFQYMNIDTTLITLYLHIDLFI